MFNGKRGRALLSTNEIEACKTLLAVCVLKAAFTFGDGTGWQAFVQNAGITRQAFASRRARSSVGLEIQCVGAAKERDNERKQ